MVAGMVSSLGWAGGCFIMVLRDQQRSAALVVPLFCGCGSTQFSKQERVQRKELYPILPFLDRMVRAVNAGRAKQQQRLCAHGPKLGCAAPAIAGWSPKFRRSEMDTAAVIEPGATARLGAWTAGLRYEAIPAAVIEHAKLCLLDGLGCGLFGARQPWGRICGDFAHRQSPGGAATLWALGKRSGPADAALANGTALHGFEIDDVHLRSLIHPGAVTIPAAVAVAETHGGSGKALLTAVVAGYEVGLRVGICAGIPHQLRGYHPTGTVGCVGAAAAVGSLLDLGAEAATHALGIAATQASGLYSAVRSGAMVKRMHAGRAAQSGVVGGMLAAHGFTGSPDALEAPFAGFLSTLGHELPAAELYAQLGERWETLEVGFKAYAACASAHTLIDAVLAMRARGLDAGNVKHLEIRMSKSAMNNVGWEYRPGGVVAAQMNGYYAAAVSLLDGEAFVDQYAPDRLADPRILGLLPKISIVHSAALDAGGAATRHAVEVEAATVEGLTFKETVEQRRGSARHPLSRAEIERKFERTAGSVMPQGRVAELRDLVFRLDTEPDMRRLSALLAGG
jgi:2-methylcitrate dehydratase PrpD